MVINSLNSKRIKIILDQIDLANNNITLNEWIGNPNKTLSLIEIILSSCIKPLLINNKETSTIICKSFSIHTYKFKVFSIDIYL